MYSVSGAVELERLEDEAVERGGEVGAAPVVVRGGRIVVLREGVVTTGHLVRVAHAVPIDVRGAVTTTHTGRIELIAIAIAVAGWDFGASTIIDGAWPIADATIVDHTDAIVDIVTDAV